VGRRDAAPHTRSRRPERRTLRRRRGGGGGGRSEAGAGAAAQHAAQLLQQNAADSGRQRREPQLPRAAAAPNRWGVGPLASAMPRPSAVLRARLSTPARVPSALQSGARARSIPLGDCRPPGTGAPAQPQPAAAWPPQGTHALLLTAPRRAAEAHAPPPARAGPSPPTAAAETVQGRPEAHLPLRCPLWWRRRWAAQAPAGVRLPAARPGPTCLPDQ
jgi:hypothetical protein